MRESAINKYLEFVYAANFCYDTYGMRYNRDEDWFICPDCGEPLLYSDYSSSHWDECPVCDFKWFDNDDEEIEDGDC